MTLDNVQGMTIYERSVFEQDGTTFLLARDVGDRVLCVVGDSGGFEGEKRGDVLVCPLNVANARAMRQRFAWLSPQPLGLSLSAGCGDRLGLATPGHIRAVRQAGSVAPILAQQSMRENARTHRTPQEVVDDAMWGVVQEGWRDPWGADADHLKTTADVDLCAAAGYTFYTVDPGDHVDNGAHTASMETLKDKVHALPWLDLEDSVDGHHQRYLRRRFDVEGLVLVYEHETLARAAAKYGRAIAHTCRMYRHLVGVMGDRPFELEVSVDETQTPTSPEEHYYVASELQRLGVQWVSLAPRYIGEFEKGVDYVGDLEAFDVELAKHAAIARAMGPYKLSIHSGSDKFSVYPLFARHAGELAHLKTAGTSYLEAVRAIAGVDPVFFRDILTLALERYDEDRATYHVSAEASKVPAPGSLADDQLARVLDTFDGREVLHVTFGSVLDAYGERLLDVLDSHEEAHYAALETHFERHLSPFV